MEELFFLVATVHADFNALRNFIGNDRGDFYSVIFHEDGKRRNRGNCSFTDNN